MGLEMREVGAGGEVKEFDGGAFGATGIAISNGHVSGDRRKLTYVAKTGACSCTLKLRRVSRVARMVFTLLSMRMSQSLTSPERHPVTSSRWPPRCKWTFVIHWRCSFQTLTMAVAGFSRWSYTRTAPSPKPAMKTSPSTWSEVSEVMQEPERAGISYEM